MPDALLLFEGLKNIIVIITYYPTDGKWKGVFNKMDTVTFGTASLKAFVSCTKKLN